MLILACQICIELIRDHIFAALALFTQGADLFKKYDRIKLGGQEQELFETLKLMFARLGVLVTAAGHPCSLNVVQGFDIRDKYPVFANLSDARSSLNTLMADSHFFICDSSMRKASQVCEDNDYNQRFNYSFDNSTSGATFAYGEDRIPEESGAGFPTAIAIETGHWKSHRDKSGSHIRASEDNYISITEEHDGLSGITQYKCGCGNDQNCGCQNDPSRAISAELNKRRAEILQLSVDAGPMTCISSSQDEQHELENRFNQWYDAFERIRSTLKDTELEAASSLLIHYHVSLLWLTTRLAPQQLVFEEYEYHFRKAIQHAERYLNSAKDLEKSVFTFEAATIPPLFFVAIKCRVLTLRRKALQLLSKAPRKECECQLGNTVSCASQIPFTFHILCSFFLAVMPDLRGGRLRTMTQS